MNMNKKLKITLSFGLLLSLFSSNAQIINLSDFSDSTVYPSLSVNEQQLSNQTIFNSTDKIIHPDSLLKFFYPGNLYRFFYGEGDTTSVVLWNCSRCKIDTIMLSGLEDSLYYVDTVIYDTRLLLLDYFTDAKNDRYAWFAANTTPYQSDFLLTGRFCSGILSVGLLKLQPDGWRVITYNNSVGCFGQFCMAPKPNIVEYKKSSFGLMFTDYFGGFGGPFTGTKFLYDFDGKSIVNLLIFDNSNFSFTDSSYWDTQLNSFNNDTLELITEGKLLKKDFTELEYDFSILPDELKNAFKKKSSFSFTYIRHFALKQNKYSLINTNFKIK